MTQFLFWYCIIQPVFSAVGKTSNLTGSYVLLLCLSSVLIAAGGYVINDYFDVNIDLVNKPDKLVVQRYINRRWTIFWHLMLSLIGISIGFYLDFTTKVTLLGFSNIACVVLLFLYSISFKKKLLIGNILISLLTGWVILVLAWCEARFFVTPRDLNMPRIARFTFLYGGFAFVISLVREIVKDMEDIEGDRRWGCTTMPIVWGLNVSKMYAAIWLIVLLFSLIFIQIYVLQFGWWISALWCFMLLVLPLVYSLKLLYEAKDSGDFHRLSSLIKAIMLAGIFSMVFYRLYS
jgi:4-hydroxybenzoate polyprenyltransferase